MHRDQTYYEKSNYCYLGYRLTAKRKTHFPLKMSPVIMKTKDCERKGRSHQTLSLTYSCMLSRSLTPWLLLSLFRHRFNSICAHARSHVCAEAIRHSLALHGDSCSDFPLAAAIVTHTIDIVRFLLAWFHRLLAWLLSCVIPVALLVRNHR